MKNKITIGVIVALIISSVGLFLGFQNENKSQKELSKLNERIDAEAQRLNKRTTTNIYSGEPVGYVIEFENGTTFYISGDTGPMADMTVIRDYFKPEVAVLPIGGFFTMGPAEAAFSASLVKPQNYVIPYHYGSYPMLTQNPVEFKDALKKYDLADRFLAPKNGEEKNIMGVKFVWLGHASLLLISPEGKNILIDPATPLGVFPEKYKDFSAFGKVDLVLLTHGHPDHTVISDLNKLGKMYNPIFIAPYELGTWVQERINFPESVFALANKGANITAQEFAKIGYPAEKIGKIKIYLVPASHSSSVAPQ